MRSQPEKCDACDKKSVVGLGQGWYCLACFDKALELSGEQLRRLKSALATIEQREKTK